MAATFPAIDDDQGWASALQDLNAWRGRCLQWFATAEASVTDTLLFLQALPHRGEAVKLRHLAGQRFEDLAALVCEGAPFAPEGCHVVKALAAYRKHEVLRNMLAHGYAKIALERTGEWLAVFRMTAIRAQQPVKLDLVIEQADTRRLAQDVQRAAQSLAAHLANLRAVLGAQSIGT